MRLYLLLLLLSVSLSAAPLMAKPVMETPLDDALRDAPVILVAEVTGSGFDDLAPGNKRQTNRRFFLPLRYQVLEVLRDRDGALGGTTELLLSTKSNTCLIWEETVCRDGHRLRFTREEDGRTVETIIDVPVGRRDLLLLDAELDHFGRFVSPRTAETSLIEKIRGLH